MIYLISIYENRLFFEDLGINRIAAFLDEQGIDYNFSYIKCNSEIDSETWSKIIMSDFLGISVYDNNVDYADKIVSCAKEANPKLFAFYGSQYASIAYKDILEKNENIDCIILGDGEYTILDIIRAQDAQARKKLIQDSPYLVSNESQVGKYCRFTDIQTLPWPRYNKEYYKKNLHIDLNSSSGCVGNCSFCGSLRRKWSGRTPQSIADHIYNTERQTNIHSFYFSDSSFEDPGEIGKVRISEIADAIRERGINCSFSANIRAETFKDDVPDIALLSKLQQVGFSQLFIGVESGNAQDLIIYNKRASVMDNRRIIGLLKKVGIEPFWGFIMFNPYSTQQTLTENCRFLADMQSYISYHYISFLTIYNGTSIYKRTQEDGLLKHDGRNNITYTLQDKDTEQLYQWVSNNIINSELLNVMKQSRDFFHLFYYMKPLLPDLETLYGREIKEMKEVLSSINQDFFMSIYTSGDLEQADIRLPSFAQEIRRIWAKLSYVQAQVLKKYYSKYK